MTEKLGPPPQRELSTSQPKYIQRCQLDFDTSSLVYEYMGSTEFEVGDQSKSLKRIFAGGIRQYSVTIHFDQKIITFSLVAARGFNVEAYKKVLLGLLDRKIPLKEPDCLRYALKPSQDNPEMSTNVWFDFTNDILFTLGEPTATKLVEVLEKIEEKWNIPDPVEIIAFKQELEEVKKELRTKNLGWFSLSTVHMSEDGTIRALLNPYDQQKNRQGWYTLGELRLWGQGKGPVLLR